jgi:hypothetical protein
MKLRIGDSNQFQEYNFPPELTINEIKQQLGFPPNLKLLIKGQIIPEKTPIGTVRYNPDTDFAVPIIDTKVWDNLPVGVLFGADLRRREFYERKDFLKLKRDQLLEKAAIALSNKKYQKAKRSFLTAAMFSDELKEPDQAAKIRQNIEDIDEIEKRIQANEMD